MKTYDNNNLFHQRLTVDIYKTAAEIVGKCSIALFTIQLIKWVMLLLSIYLPFATLDNSVHSYTSCCGKPIKHVIVFAINHIKYYINIYARYNRKSS